MEEITETTEGTQQPHLVSFLSQDPDIYTYTPTGFDKDKGEVTIVRLLTDKTQESQGGKKENPTEKGRITLPLEELDRGIDWLGRQHVGEPGQAVNLARTAVNLAKVASFARQSQS
ncbi:MAG: hypothetical protein A2171_00385 [Candidatus Levybacteria bacterium RBG_13_35_9]|nr:MAG: hypothetical protein A2171_00385 [Candidatus Levybacteria bacterium RBG_13_35_9]